MRGFLPSSYGDGFADVYDEWYGDVTDVAATVGRVTALTEVGGRVLELGVGTGRLATPLARAGLHVVGIDSSRAMLARIDTAGCGARLSTVAGDMVDDVPDGPFDVVLIAYNTIFNLLSAERQRACFVTVADRLRAGGAFVVEAALPVEDLGPGCDVAVRSIEIDRVVLSVTDHRPDEQSSSGQFVELSESGGVRLRPWAIRWASPAELDAMAAAAGLELERRDADMSGAPFEDDAEQHVSVYRKADRR